MKKCPYKNIFNNKIFRTNVDTSEFDINKYLDFALDTKKISKHRKLPPLLLNIPDKLNENSTIDNINSCLTSKKSGKNISKLNLYKELSNEGKHKNISLTDRGNSSYQISKKLKNIKERKTINRHIAYDTKDLDIILSPVKLINDYNRLKKCDLGKNKENIKSFMKEKIDITRQNHILKLLGQQKQNYISNLKQYQTSINDNRETIDNLEKNFHRYTKIQKNLNQNIYDTIFKLANKNRILLYDLHKLEMDIKLKEDERQRLLERIEQFRIIAKFVTKSLSNNIDVFDKKLIPDYDLENTPKYENIAEEVLEKYDFLISQDIDIENENTSIGTEYDDNILYLKFHRIEDNIINLLNEKEYLDKEILSIKNDSKKQLLDIKQRKIMLEDELTIDTSLYKREKKEYEDIFIRSSTSDQVYYDLLFELFLEVCTIFENEKINQSNFDIKDTIKEMQKIINDKEEQINQLQFGMEELEKKDKKLFENLVYRRKNENKEIKVNIMKKIIEDDKKLKLEKKRKIPKKIFFKQRKVEAPFFIKKKVIIKFEPNLIKEEEDEELLNY